MKETTRELDEEEEVELEMWRKSRRRREYGEKARDEGEEDPRRRP